MEVFIGHSEHRETEGSALLSSFKINTVDAGRQHNRRPRKCPEVAGDAGNASVKSNKTFVARNAISYVVDETPMRTVAKPNNLFKFSPSLSGSASLLLLYIHVYLG